MHECLPFHSEFGEKGLLIEAPLFAQGRNLFHRLNDDVLRAGDGVGRSLRLLVRGRSDREDQQLTGRVADGVEVVVVIPEYLANLFFGKQPRVMGDGL